MRDRLELIVKLHKAIKESDRYGIAQIYIATLMHTVKEIENKPTITRGDLESFYFGPYPGGNIKEIPAEKYNMIMAMVDRLITLLESKGIPVMK